jgi:hypothetical protein
VGALPRTPRADLIDCEEGGGRSVCGCQDANLSGWAVPSGENLKLDIRLRGSLSTQCGGMHRLTYDSSRASPFTDPQVVGQLFVQIIRSPARDFIGRWRFSTPDKGSLFRIWPPAGFSIRWPGRTMTDRDADYVTTALRDYLMRIVEARGRKPPS